MMRKILMLLLGAVISVGLFAQEVALKGVVTSAGDNEPLPGVTVVVKGTTNGTVTNIDGIYQLSVSADAILQFSFVGMKTQEVAVSGRTEINVQLESAAFDVDEVVVVGYGVQKKSLVTGAIAKVDGDELKKSSDMRLTQALQGKTAGVVIAGNSGQPGDQVSVRIRGIGTNGDAEPLYIIDGLPMSSAGTDFLSSGDIESIEILKDAASSAIYGARGANGVILITTKKGNANEKFTVSYDGYYGVQNPWKKLNLLNAREYTMLTNEASLNGNGTLYFTNEELAGFTADTDWQDEMFNYDAPKQNHSFSFTGGTQKTTYSSSFNYFNQEGIVAKGKSKYERFSIRLNTNSQFGFFNLGTNVNLVRVNSKGIDTNDHFGNGLAQAINMPPIVPVTNSDGSWSTPEQFGIGLQEITNPIALLDQLNHETKTSKFIGGLTGTVDFGKLVEALNGLTFKSSYSGELALVDGRGYRPYYYLDALHFTITDEASRHMELYTRWNFENVLTYDKTIQDHHFTLMAGTTGFKNQYDNVGGSKKDVIFDDLGHSYIDNATDPESMNVYGGFSEHTVASVFGRLNYDYKDRYMFAATLRRDGSSRFGSENKYGYFPSVSMGWVLSREEFMAGLADKLDLLKIRASWGQNGSENIGDFGYTSIIGNQNIYYFGDSKTQYNGTQPTRIANPSLKWETSEQTNVGIDMATLENSLRVSLDYYVKTTKDWLVTAPVPMLVGNSAPTINGGKVRNSGFEAEVSYRKELGKLYVSASINGAYNKNEVLDIQNAEKRLQGGDGGFGQSGVLYAAVGTPMGIFWGAKTDGIFQTVEEVNAYTNDEGGLIQPNAKPGDIRFVDANGDGQISEDDYMELGSPYPDFTGGLNLTLEYGGFDFTAFLYAALGQEVYDATRRYDMNGTNYRSDWLNRWTGPGTSNEYPRVTFVDDNQNMKTVSDFFVHDGSFVRLRNVTLGYTLPKTVTSYLKIDRVRFYVSAENLLTFTKYDGYDPEIGGGVFSNGIDHGIYPQARTVLGGVNITF
ncbi:TonB-dependent receptor [Maribellus sp. CM-23]|uniref:SusC/RagA family TonB-linked outer membrane protein n=1 Tax=Maribellus sp. CM-23 TaxID=2781026 RepID=UPI001F3F6B39|nr:TonB-dependent receptor [Maribellus sp. CM-23]MCE4563911.1 TonB-dependent receptor [Maribellus sp. CM-23]